MGCLLSTAARPLGLRICNLFDPWDSISPDSVMPREGGVPSHPCAPRVAQRQSRCQGLLGRLPSRAMTPRDRTGTHALSIFPEFWAGSFHAINHATDVSE